MRNQSFQNINKMSFKLILAELLNVFKTITGKPKEIKVTEPIKPVEEAKPVETVKPAEVKTPEPEVIKEKPPLVTTQVVVIDPAKTDKVDLKTTTNEPMPEVKSVAATDLGAVAKEKSTVTAAIMTAKIVSVTESYIGKTEKPGNSGFNDATFEKKMKEVGWSTSQSWCSYFAELAVTEAFKELGMVGNAYMMKKLFSGGATATFKNFDLDGTYKTGKAPKVGSLAVWRLGNSWQGHIGVVVAVDPATGVFKCVEGNTNDGGGREGYIVAKKTRKTGLPYAAKGLNLIGFVYLV